MVVEQVLAAFAERREAFIQELMTFLRFPTISAQPEHKADMRACAQWVRDQLLQAGLKAQIMETGGHPAVFADSGPANAEARAPTILCYGHYDVQPIGAESQWTSPAFEPVIRDGAVFARGSTDDKGQVMTHLAAVQSWRVTGQPWPTRIKFLIEGEEEIGSLNLPGFVKDHRDLLACDYVVLSDTAKHDADTPALTFSTRGLVYKQITVQGPVKDLHSGVYGGAVANPANVLARLIASWHDEAQRVTIPGFYDDVRPLPDEDRRSLAEMGISDAELLAATGSPAPSGEEGFTSAERCRARPTLDVNALVSGYTGEGSATIIPARASAKVSMRLVADQDPARISRAFDEAVRRWCPPTVRLEVKTQATCAPYRAPTDSAGVRVAIRALTDSYSRPPVLAREGGTLPILPLFKEVLGADSVMLGFAMPDANAHSPNEFFCLRDFEIGTRCILLFLAGIGQI